MPDVISVPSDDDFPSRADVVIIGGGIAGISAGLELSERGLSVVVLEKGYIACEQSGRNWGWVRRMGRDLRELPLSGISLNLWRDMNSRVDGETGFVECGISYMCGNSRELSLRRAWYESLDSSHNLSTRLLDGASACSLTPDCTYNWTGALYTPDDARAEPTLAVPAMATALRRLGGKIFQSCAARTLDHSDGTVRGIHTERGYISCPRIILAGGIWSRHFCANLGIRLPQLTVINTVMRTSPITSTDTTYSGCGFALRKRLDGGYTVAHPTAAYFRINSDAFRFLYDFRREVMSEFHTLRYGIGSYFSVSLPSRWGADDISPFELVRIFDPSPDRRTCSVTLSSLRTHVPCFRDVTITETWAGGIDLVPGLIPVISPIDNYDGFFVMTGFSGHGFGLGPGAGLLMAQLVTGESPCVDPSPFRFDRFGSPSASASPSSIRI